MFDSEIECVGRVQFPELTGIRVMMMPFHVDNPFGTLPDELRGYSWLIAGLPMRGLRGTGYLTVDEALVRKGETHRRPGLHVDGIGPDGYPGGWGGGGGWGKSGMFVAASVTGSRGWAQRFTGVPGADGDCSHLATEIDDMAEVTLEGELAYFCGPLAVHESLPAVHDQRRQFVRVSLPNACPWYEGYTPNPLGIPPAGPIHGPRQGMQFRPQGDPR